MSEWQHKLDAYSRRALQTPEGESGIDITVRLTNDDESGVQALADSGLEVQTTLGDLVAGHVRDHATLIRIAELPCVAEVQASRPLHNEPR